MNECYKIYRCYCGLTLKEVAKLTGISVKRLNEIEQGKAEPDFDEISVLASLYNVSVAVLEKPLDKQFIGIVNEPFDFSYFQSESDREMMKENITSLSEMERKIIFLFRCSDDKSDMFEKVTDILLQEKNTEN